MASLGDPPEMAHLGPLMSTGGPLGGPKMTPDYAKRYVPRIGWPILPARYLARCQDPDPGSYPLIITHARAW